MAVNKLHDYADQVIETMDQEGIDAVKSQETDTPLIEAVDAFTDTSMTFSEKVALLVENEHLKHIGYDPDLTSFGTIVDGCAYDLIMSACRARLAESK